MVANMAVFLVIPPVFVIASLAMPAGVGGGLLYVPLMVAMGVVGETRAAAALAQPLVFGATLAAMVYNLAWQRRHPGKKLVEPEIALAALPPCLAGTLLGTVLNQMLPDALIHLVLIATLVTCLRHTLRKAIHMWGQESAAKRAAAAAVPGSPAQSIGAGSQGCGGAHAASADTSASTTPELAGTEGVSPAGTAWAEERHLSPVYEGAEADQDTPHSSYSIFHLPSVGESSVRRRPTAAALEAGELPAGSAPSPSAAAEAAPAAAGAAPVKAETSRWQHLWSVSGKQPRAQAWLLLLVVWGILVVSLVLRGGKGSVSVIGVRMCSWEYWCITGIAFCFLLATGLCVQRPEAQPGVCFAVGTLSSIVGIGGGIVLNPMLLSAGVAPAVTMATTTVMIALTSSNATINFVLANAIPVLPTLVLSAASFFGSLCGKTAVGYVVARTGRNSILVFMLAAFMSVSSVAVVVEGVSNAIATVDRSENPLAQFDSPCA